MISLCMIVRDEELALPRCLDSVEGIFDEIIIVDTGSTDKTREIAEKRVGKVYDFKWIDDFSAARNYALSLAKGDWLMWLDADDVIEGENRGLLKEQIASLDTEQPDVVMLPYNVGFDECGRVTLSYERERIFRAAAGLRFEGAVHEAVAPRGKVVHGQAAVSHRKLRPNPAGTRKARETRARPANEILLRPRARRGGKTRRGGGEFQTLRGGRIRVEGKPPLGSEGAFRLPSCPRKA